MVNETRSTKWLKALHFSEHLVAVPEKPVQERNENLEPRALIQCSRSIPARWFCKRKTEELIAEPKSGASHGLQAESYEKGNSGAALLTSWRLARKRKSQTALPPTPQQNRENKILNARERPDCSGTWTEAVPAAA
jgi:hypothetical protein